jgi:GTPase
MISLIMKKFPNQSQEDYYGNREYKFLLNNNIYTKKEDNIEEYKNIDCKKYKKILTNKRTTELKRLQKRATQMLFRINEGKGKAIYIIGIEDNGKSTGVPLNNIYDAIVYLELMKIEIKANINCYRIYLGEKGFILTARVFIEPFKEIEFF